MPKHYHSGFDYFTPDPGVHQSMSCNACNTEMDVKRNGDSSISRWEPKLTKKSDIFTCPYSGEPWHDQVIALCKFKRDTPSKVLSDLVDQEILDIVKNKKATKDTWF